MMLRIRANQEASCPVRAQYLGSNALFRRFPLLILASYQYSGLLLNKGFVGSVVVISVEPSMVV